jgi:hypothetical protein
MYLHEMVGYNCFIIFQYYYLNLKFYENFEIFEIFEILKYFALKRPMLLRSNVNYIFIYL